MKFILPVQLTGPMHCKDSELYKISDKLFIPVKVALMVSHGP